MMLQVVNIENMRLVWKRLGVDVIYTFESNTQLAKELQWRVLYIDKLTKTVELTTSQAISKTVSFSGLDGYKNAINVLDDSCNVYCGGKGAISGRSIRKEDIDYITGFNKYEYRESDDYYGDIYYGEERSYTSGTFYNEDGSEMIASEKNPVIMRNYLYEYIFEDYIKDSVVLKMINTGSAYWFANQYIYLSKFGVSYGIFINRINCMSGHGLFRNYKTDFTEVGSNVRPVVTLNSNIKTENEKKDDIWQLVVE